LFQSSLQFFFLFLFQEPMLQCLEGKRALNLFSK
jgi:hypothetical protein